MPTLRARLTGIWQLLHYETWRADGDVMPPKGWGSEPPKASLSYYLGGRMWVQHVGLQRPLFAAGYIADALDKSLISAPHNVLAYSGAWEVDEAAETVTHHVELNGISSWKSSAQVCKVRCIGSHLELIGPQTLIFGENRVPHFSLILAC